MLIFFALLRASRARTRDYECVLADSRRFLVVLTNKCETNVNKRVHVRATYRENDARAVHHRPHSGEREIKKLEEKYRNERRTGQKARAPPTNNKKNRSTNKADCCVMLGIVHEEDGELAHIHSRE